MICLRNCRRTSEVSHVDSAIIKVLHNKVNVCPALPISLLTSSFMMYPLTERTWESHTGIKGYQCLHHWKDAKDRSTIWCLWFSASKNDCYFPSQSWCFHRDSDPTARAGILQAVKCSNFSGWTTIVDYSVLFILIFMQHHSLRPE